MSQSSWVNFCQAYLRDIARREQLDEGSGLGKLAYNNLWNLLLMLSEVLHAGINIFP